MRVSPRGTNLWKCNSASTEISPVLPVACGQTGEIKLTPPWRFQEEKKLRKIMRNTINLGTEEKPNVKAIHTWRIEQGCVAIPATDKTEWLATVTANRAAKTGGIDRLFWDRGQSGWAVIPNGITPGDYIENGTKDKKGETSYRYYRVLVVTEDRIVVRGAGKPPTDPKPIERELILAEITPPPSPAEQLASRLAQFTTSELEAEIQRRASAESASASS